MHCFICCVLKKSLKIVTQKEIRQTDNDPVVKSSDSMKHLTFSHSRWISFAIRSAFARVRKAFTSQLFPDTIIYQSNYFYNEFADLNIRCD